MEPGSRERAVNIRKWGFVLEVEMPRKAVKGQDGWPENGLRVAFRL